MWPIPLGLACAKFSGPAWAGRALHAGGFSHFCSFFFAPIGFCVHLPKPCSRSTIDTLLGARSIPHLVSLPPMIFVPPPPIEPSLRVLLVEDSHVNQQLLTQILLRQDCLVTVAGNGEEAVQRFAEQAFDVVLMDVQMPVMDGLTATRMIRNHENGIGKRTPIIAVTAGVDRESCLQAGMDEHLQKPVRPEVLRSTLQQVMRLAVKHRSPAA